MANKEKAPDAGEAATAQAPALKLLGKDAFLNAPPLKHEIVEIPEMGGSVMVWEMSADEKDDYEDSCIAQRGKDRVFSLRGVRAKLCARALKDENGVRLFKDDQIGQLGKVGSAILDRIFPVASRLSALSKADIDELAGELKNGHSGEPS